MDCFFAESDEMYIWEVLRKPYFETIDVVETVLSQGVALCERVVGQIQHAQLRPRLAIDESLTVGKLVVAQIQLFERLCSAHPR